MRENAWANEFRNYHGIELMLLSVNLAYNFWVRPNEYSDPSLHEYYRANRLVLALALLLLDSQLIFKESN